MRTPLKIEALGRIFPKSNETKYAQYLSEFYFARTMHLHAELMADDLRFVMVGDLEKVEADERGLIDFTKPLPVNKWQSRVFLIGMMYEVFEFEFYQWAAMGHKVDRCRDESYMLASLLISIARLFTMPDRKLSGVGSKSKGETRDKYLGRITAIHKKLTKLCEDVESGADSIPTIVFHHLNEAEHKAQLALRELEKFTTPFAKASKQAITKSDDEVILFNDLVAIIGGEEKMATATATRIINALLADLKLNRFPVNSGARGWRQRVSTKRSKLAATNKKKSSRRRMDVS
jgi:hypothetical protein